MQTDGVVNPMLLPPAYVLTIHRGEERRRQFRQAWPELAFEWFYGDDHLHYRETAAFAEYVERHGSHKLLRIIPQHWLPRIFVTINHLRMLRAALAEHPDVPGILVFEDDAVPTLPDVGPLIAAAIQRHPERSRKFSGLPNAADWMSYACNYVTLPAARRMLAAEQLCNIDWMFWTLARPDLAKPYPVEQRVGSLYQ